MIVILIALLVLAEANAAPSGRRRRRRRRRSNLPEVPEGQGWHRRRATSAPTPAPLPPDDPGKLCEWWKAGMTWDCSCKAHAYGCVGCGQYPNYKDVMWWFSPCSKKGYNCHFARRRKKLTSVCGATYLGATGAHPHGNRDVRNFGGLMYQHFSPDHMAVARFTVERNRPEDKKNGSKFKYFWGDDDDSITARPGWLKKGGCTTGYMGNSGCKCTCVMGKNMLAHGDMKALLPYRGPGDRGYYKPPVGETNAGSAAHGAFANWGDHAHEHMGSHNEMYATYCIGVCGADCDGPKHTGTRFGKNILFAVLVAHDVCQAYIGSKDDAVVPEGVRNGCGDEVYARNWKDETSPNSQGAKAAGASLSVGGAGQDGMSCDSGA